MKKLGMILLSIGLFSLILFGKYKLMTAKATGTLIILGAIMFAASTDSQAR